MSRAVAKQVVSNIVTKKTTVYDKTLEYSFKLKPY